MESVQNRQLHPCLVPFATLSASWRETGPLAVQASAEELVQYDGEWCVLAAGGTSQSLEPWHGAIPASPEAEVGEQPAQDKWPLRGQDSVSLALFNLCI